MKKTLYVNKDIMLIDTRHGSSDEDKMQRKHHYNIYAGKYPINVDGEVKSSEFYFNAKSIVNCFPNRCEIVEITNPQIIQELKKELKDVKEINSRLAAELLAEQLKNFKITPPPEPYRPYYPYYQSPYNPYYTTSTTTGVVNE